MAIINKGYIATLKEIYSLAKSKLNKYQQEIEESAFASIKERVKFFDYDKVVGLYNAQVAASQFNDFFA